MDKTQKDSRERQENLHSTAQSHRSDSTNNQSNQSTHNTANTALNYTQDDIDYIKKNTYISWIFAILLWWLFGPYPIDDYTDYEGWIIFGVFCLVFSVFFIPFSIYYKKKALIRLEYISQRDDLWKAFRNSVLVYILACIILVIGIICGAITDSSIVIALAVIIISICLIYALFLEYKYSKKIAYVTGQKFIKTFALSFLIPAITPLINMYYWIKFTKVKNDENVAELKIWHIICILFCCVLLPLLILLSSVATPRLVATRTDAQVAMARSDISSTLQVIPAAVFAENVNVRQSKYFSTYNKTTMDWADWIIDVGGLDRSMWTTIAGIGIAPIVKNEGRVYNCGMIIWIDTATGSLHFDPNNLNDNDKFCRGLREAYPSGSNRIIPLSLAGKPSF